MTDPQLQVSLLKKNFIMAAFLFLNFIKFVCETDNIFIVIKLATTYLLRSCRSIRSTQVVATQLCSLLWPPLLPRLDPSSSVRFRWFFAKLFLVFLLVFCLLVSILELSLVLMICPFLRGAQAIGVVSGLV